MSIPILLHFFNFQKFRTVYFSNVDLLREIKEESKKARKLKNWLVLLFRVLFIAFLVFAFAFPFSGENLHKNDSVISIYIDNSFSMDNEGTEGNKFNNAKAYADQILFELPPNAKIHLVTNDFRGKHQVILNKRSAQEEISKIEPSHLSRSFKSILNRQTLFLEEYKNKNNKLYWISDFQQLYSNEIANPDSLQIKLAFLKSSEKLNLSMDSIWFQSPVRKKIGDENLKFTITNDGNETLRNQIIKLSINNRINSLTIPKLDPGKNTFDFTFQIPEDSIIKGAISLEDQSLLFDNELLFSYLIPKHQNVCLIANQNSNIIPTVKKIFKNDSTIELSIHTAIDIDYKKLSKQDLILLGELDKITQNLAIELLKLSRLGKIIGVIPGGASNAKSYNNAFKKWGNVTLGNKITSNINIGDIQKSHPFFNDVFEERKVRSNLKETFPSLYSHFSLSSNKNSETIIFKEDGSPFLITEKNFYYLASGLSNKESNFSQKALIIPLIYQMLFKSINTTPIQYFISSNTKIDVPSSSEKNVIVKNKEIISKLRVSEFKSSIPLNFKKGYYELINSKSIEGTFGLNYNRAENEVINHQIKRLQKIENSALISRVEVFGNQASNLSGLKNPKNTHWFLCILIALICLFLEMIIIRIKI